MALSDLVDLIYEDSIRNARKRRVVEIIVSESDHVTGAKVADVLRKVQEEFGEKYGRKIFYQVLGRLKELGIVKVKQERDLEGERYRVVVLTPSVFEWRVKNKILKVLKAR